MPHIAVRDGLPGIRALLDFRPETAAPLTALANALLHAPNSLSPGDRELIAAYVSRLNGCRFCQRSHAAIAACHLGSDSVVTAVIDDPDTASISPKLRALLAIAAEVQRGGREVHAETIAGARAAGASDVELHDTVLIAAAFCMFNRYVDGLATWTPDALDAYRERASQTARYGYGTPSA